MVITQTQRNAETVTVNAPAAAPAQTRPQTALPVDALPIDTVESVTTLASSLTDAAAPAQTRPQTALPVDTLSSESVVGVTAPTSSLTDAAAPAQTRPQTSLPVDALSSESVGGVTAPTSSLNDAAAPTQTRPQTSLPVDALSSESVGGVTALASSLTDAAAPAQTRPQTALPVDALPIDRVEALSRPSFKDQEAETVNQTPKAGGQNAAALPHPLQGKDEQVTASMPIDAGNEQQPVITRALTTEPDRLDAAAAKLETVRHEANQGMPAPSASRLPALAPSPDRTGTGNSAAQGSGFISKRLLSALQPVQTAIRVQWQKLTHRWYQWRDTRQGPAQARQWLESLDWYRLRYQSAPLTRQGLLVLAGAAGCGRVALVHTLYPWPHLYLGLPPEEGSWARQVAADYQFHLQPAPAPDALMTLRLQPTNELDWQRPFLAHLVGERLFVMHQDAAASDTGQFWPGQSVGQEGQNWQLPDLPPFGLTTQPQLRPAPIPAAMRVTGKPDGSHWLLGHDAEGKLIQAITPQVMVGGNEDAVTLWLEQAALASLALQPAGLVILDGQGQLTHRLRRHALVNELLNRKQLTLASITEAGESRIGFNPLALVPGESEAHTVTRWQAWFAGMGCSWQTRTLLLEAYREGVRELNQLHRWLAQPARLGQPANALLSLKTVLHRLITAAAVRDWLEWPTNLFAPLTEKAVLFTCPGSEAWEKQQLLQAMFLGVQAAGRVRLILTGTGAMSTAIRPESRVLAGNGLFLPGATQVVTTLDGAGMAQIDNLPSSQPETLLQELLPLLGPGESVVLLETGSLRLAW